MNSINFRYQKKKYHGDLTKHADFSQGGKYITTLKQILTTYSCACNQSFYSLHVTTKFMIKGSILRR